MDDEIEDMVGEIKYTDSQKSVTTRSSLAYSIDFTDSSSPRSDRHNSFGRETYVIECDSEDSEKSEKSYALHDCASTNITDTNETSLGETSNEMTLISVQCGPSQTVTRCASTSYHTIRSVVAQETYTQTSKTIIEIAETEGNMKRVMESKSLETQTSCVSITENKTVEYRIELSNVHDRFATSEVLGDSNQTVLQLMEDTPKNEQNSYSKSEYYNSEQKPQHFNVTCNQLLHATLDDKSSKFHQSESDSERIVEIYRSDADSSDDDNSDIVIPITNDDSNNDFNDVPKLQVASSDNEESAATDIEEDSLMDGNPPSSNKDVRELHDKISENDDICMPERYAEPDIWRFGMLTPLTEETNIRKESLQDFNDKTKDENKEHDEVLFTSAAGVKVKVLKNDESAKNPFKLPPIQNHSCPTSPHLNSLFGKPKLSKAGTLPSLYERQDRWEIGTKNLASGESPLISGRCASPKKSNRAIQLPPIYGEMVSKREETLTTKPPPAASAPTLTKASDNQDAISIKEKIKELKINSKRSWSQKYSSHSLLLKASGRSLLFSMEMPVVGGTRRIQSRSISPDSAGWHDEIREVADRGCEVVCVDLLRRLRSTSWFEVIETLEELPKELEKFWGVITETRIADLLRQVNMLVESPRPQVAKTACGTAAAIIKNTNYTRKPDFYETVTTLLVKTGSYSRAVRRAANLALDHVMCGVDVTHAVSALCIHGVGHKNGVVRCAAARLLVVCCALAGGGRGLLRARPPSAAAARRHVLRALARLLDDKSGDTRKYAERLYSMLRPLSNFEAYYLTDVTVEVASKQMKKYDQLLICSPSKETR